MLTIKHVDDAATETIYPATEVRYTAPIQGYPTSRNSMGYVWYTDPRTSEVKNIEGGTVYVMNEAGKTVSTYRMTPEYGSGEATAPDRQPPHFLKPDGRIG